MAIALAATPLYDTVFRIHIRAFPTTLLEVLLVPAILVGLWAGWGQLPWRNPYTLPAAILLVGATLNTYFTPNVQAALGIWKAYFVEPLLASVVIAWLAQERERVRLLLAGLAVAGLIVAIANLANFAEALIQHVNVAHAPPVALYRTANAIPLFLVPLDAFALAIALYSDDRRERILAAAFFAITGLAVLASLSRAGWAGFAVMAVAIALFHPRRRLVALPIAVGIVLALLIPATRRRILTEFDLSSPDNTITLRLSLWQSTLNMLAHRPFFGGGLAGFRTSLVPYQVRTYSETQVYPHNVFLTFWSETGLVGLAGFVWTALQVFRTALRGLRSGPWARAVSIGLLGAIIAITVHGQFDVPYFKNDLAVEFWALLGIQLGALLEAKNA